MSNFPPVVFLLRCLVRWVVARRTGDSLMVTISRLLRSSHSTWWEKLLRIRVAPVEIEVLVAVKDGRPQTVARVVRILHYIDDGIPVGKRLHCWRLGRSVFALRRRKGR